MTGTFPLKVKDILFWLELIWNDQPFIDKFVTFQGVISEIHWSM